MKTKNFNVRGSRWNEIEKSKLGGNFILIRRPASASIMAKQGGRMATAIDVHINELPKNYQALAKTF